MTALTWKMHQMRCTVICCAVSVMYRFQNRDWGYFEEDHAFHDQQQNHMVDLPDIGFLFPAFNNRSEDGEGVLYYSKDANAFEQLFLAQVLNCEVPLSAGSQKENFQVLVEETLGEECNYETIKNIHENLNEMIQEQKGNPEPVTIDKTEMRDLLEKSGVKEERLQDFEEHFEAGDRRKYTG